MALKKVPVSTRPCCAVQAGVGLAGIDVGVYVTVGDCVGGCVGSGVEVAPGTGVTRVVGVSWAAPGVVAEGAEKGDGESLGGVELAETLRALRVGGGALVQATSITPHNERSAKANRPQPRHVPNRPFIRQVSL